MEITDYKALKNSRTLSVLLRGAPASEIKVILDNLKSIYERVLHEEEQEKAKAAQQTAEIKDILEAMDSKNITVEMLKAYAVENQTIRKRRNKVKDKYRYPDDAGNFLTWTGQGRTPRGLKTLLDAGHDLSEYLIPQSEQVEE